MNNITLIGRLTATPEIKGNSDKRYCKFTLAVSRQMKKDTTDFINCVSFGKTAEIMGEYLKKGSKVAILGELQIQNYEKDGIKSTSYSVIVKNLYFLEKKDEILGDIPKEEFPF